jgi:hypothetical protein
MNRRLTLALLALAMLCSTQVQAQKSLSTAEARNHIGEKATVCGAVVSTHYAAQSRGNPTFINLDKPYPNQVFTVLIWGSDRQKFGDPEETYRSKIICVTGKISDYKGVPEIVAYAPSQIEFESGR